MSDTLNWDELDHSDDWPDRTTREPEMIPDEQQVAEVLAPMEARLDALHDSPEVQQWLADGGLTGEDSD